MIDFTNGINTGEGFLIAGGIIIGIVVLATLIEKIPVITKFLKTPFSIFSKLINKKRLSKMTASEKAKRARKIAEKEKAVIYKVAHKRDIEISQAKELLNSVREIEAKEKLTKAVAKDFKKIK